MIDRRRATRLALAAAAWPGACLLAPSAARAEPAFQRFIPLLVDLPGWKGNKPDGMSMEMSSGSMTTATRAYERGQARLNAQIIIGPAALGALATIAAKMKIETSDMRMSTSTVDGFQVARTFNFKDKSGAVMVGLSANAVFSVSFNGVDDEEALTLAQKFDWKAIQAAIPK